MDSNPYADLKDVPSYPQIQPMQPGYNNYNSTPNQPAQPMFPPPPSVQGMYQDTKNSSAYMYSNSPQYQQTPSPYSDNKNTSGGMAIPQPPPGTYNPTGVPQMPPPGMAYPQQPGVPQMPPPGMAYPQQPGVPQMPPPGMAYPQQMQQGTAAFAPPMGMQLGPVVMRPQDQNIYVPSGTSSQFKDTKLHESYMWYSHPVGGW